MIPLTVWLAAAHEVPPRPDLLDETEQARLLLLHHEADRRRAAAAWTLRRLVFSSLWPGVAPAAWRFAAGRFGKPFVASPAEGAALRHNLSHAGAYVALSVGEVESGVDLECIPQGGLVLDPALHPREREAMPPGLPDLELLDLWTAKEAVLKFWGTGLSLAPDRLWLERSASGFVLRNVERSPEEAMHPAPAIASFTPIPGYSLAVAAPADATPWPPRLSWWSREAPSPAPVAPAFGRP